MVFFLCLCYNHFRCAGMAELADAHGSGPCARKGVGVQLPPCARWGSSLNVGVMSSRKSPVRAIWPETSSLLADRGRETAGLAVQAG